MPATSEAQLKHLGKLNASTRDSLRHILKEQYGVDSCELCGYIRITEVAHIIEKRNGGKYLANNCLLLCPNHHHLFDHSLLKLEEIKKLQAIDRLNGNLQGRLNYVPE